MYWHEGGSGAGWGLLLVVMVLSWLPVVALTYLVLRSQRPGPRPPEQPPRTAAGPTPVEVLDQRLARGEISVEEYQKVRNLLHAPAGP